jgi:hypothetical protein
MARENRDRVDGIVQGFVFVATYVVKIQITRVVLGHSEKPPSERRVASAPYRELRSDNSFRLI